MDRKSEIGMSDETAAARQHLFVLRSGRDTRTLRTRGVMRKGKRDGWLIAVERRKTKGVVERVADDEEAEEDRSLREEAHSAIREKLSSSALLRRDCRIVRNNPFHISFSFISLLFTHRFN